ncbi:unnamed protein product [marine sediment metagenome]|uniref:Uncharacterized protein n=1 Tax=marine sediment metagenome TaxID=412755 RepID=X1U999_9ZZZZ
MDFTWAQGGVLLGVLVVVSFIAGAVDVWWTQRKWDKKNRG